MLVVVVLVVDEGGVVDGVVVVRATVDGGAAVGGGVAAGSALMEVEEGASVEVSLVGSVGCCDVLVASCAGWVLAVDVHAASVIAVATAVEAARNRRRLLQFISTPPARRDTD